MKNKKNIKEKIEDFFEMKQRKTNVKTEIYAGITTFLAMAYILIVNPHNILLNGTADPRFSSVFMATAIGSFVGTVIMALLAKVPLAQAPGMGLNAIVGAIIGGTFGFAYSYGNAMVLVLMSGIIFLIISFIPCGKDKVTGKRTTLREKIFDGIPKSILTSIAIGVGLFITFIGLQNAHIITNNENTLVELIKFNNPELWVKGGYACSAVVAIFGLIVIGILSHYKIKGAVIIGIISSTILAIPLGVANLTILSGNVAGMSWDFKKNIVEYFDLFNTNSVFFSIFKDGFSFPAGSFMTSLMLIISLSMIDLFDTIGTVVGCCKSANLMDENGKPINYANIMYADSVSSITGSFLGTSAISTFVESSAGASAGGRTGLTALVTAFMFLLSIFILPLFAFIPSAAAASALIYVGVLMMSNIKSIDFKNVRNAIPSFMTIIIMLLSYSITDGIGIGMIIYTIINLTIYIIDLIKFKKGKLKNKPQTEITLTTIIIVILYLIYFLVPNII